MYVFIFLVKVTEWPPIGKIAAHSAYETFLWYKYLIVSLVFFHLGFWSGNLSLIAPFPDLCLLVPFYAYENILRNCLANQSQTLCGASLGRGNESLYKWSRSHDQDGRHGYK